MASNTCIPTSSREPTSYYTRNSGIGRLIEAMHPRKGSIKVGVIGLGTGTLATYGAKGDVYRFYDINPGVVSDRAARLHLPQEQRRHDRAVPGRRSLVARARSAAAIRRPRHRRVFQRCHPGTPHHPGSGRGVPAAHEAGRRDRVPRHQPLPEPGAGGRRHRERARLHALWIDDPGLETFGNASSWVLLAKDPSRLNDTRLIDPSIPIEPRRDWRVWTDDFNNLVQVLK